MRCKTLKRNYQALLAKHLTLKGKLEIGILQVVVVCFTWNKSQFTFEIVKSSLAAD
jgi:hypothetical protein